MKRPKIADMTPLERGRFRLLQAYRGARRNLDDLKYIDEAELPPDEIGKLHKFRREMQTIVMAIPPRKTQNADVHTVKMMLASEQVLLPSNQQLLFEGKQFQDASTLRAQ